VTQAGSRDHVAHTHWESEYTVGMDLKVKAPFYKGLDVAISVERVQNVVHQKETQT